MKKYVGIIPILIEVKSFYEIDQNTFDEFECGDKIIVNGKMYMVSKVSTSSISFSNYDTEQIEEVIYEKEEFWEYKETIIKELDEGKGVVVKSAQDVALQEPNPSWTVPVLTEEQVKHIFESLSKGKQCVVSNKDETIMYVAVLGDKSSGNEAIVLQHYWLGYIDYQITADGVEITGHEIIKEEAEEEAEAEE